MIGSILCIQEVVKMQKKECENDVFNTLCLHLRNLYTCFILGFQYSRFSCDGFRFLYIIIMHCIVNVENHQYKLPECLRQIGFSQASL